MVSWWVQYLAKDPRSDFRNGPGITWIVAAFLPPMFIQIRLEQRPLPQAIPILVRGEITSVQVPTCGLLVSAISGQGPQA